jgi:hypothetical protein
MLRGHEGNISGGLRFRHHRSPGRAAALRTSADEGCCFCSVTWLSFSKLDQAIIDKTQFIEACLFDVKDEQGLYRLEFMLDGRPLATFVLEQNCQLHP